MTVVDDVFTSTESAARHAFNWAIVHKAYALMVKEGSRGMLHGTAALAAHGHAVDVGDYDFLCNSLPALWFMERTESSDPEGHSVATKIDGITADFIAVQSDSRQFFTAEPTIINGVPVAAVADVLAWKAFAGRPKDIKFLAALPPALAEQAQAGGTAP